MTFKRRFKFQHLSRSSRTCASPVFSRKQKEGQARHSSYPNFQEIPASPTLAYTAFKFQRTGVISKEAQGVEPTLLKLLIILGGSAPKNSCAVLAFQRFLALPPKHFLLLCSIMHCYMFIETVLIFDYTKSVLN